jgi:17beta-estradiol 17-dehydrogenase / very-long-chain 3-oxoacyl-CoA reductase
MDLGLRPHLDRLRQHGPHSALLRGLAILGSLYTVQLLTKAASFVYLHFLRPNKLRAYAAAPDGSPAWALITGSSDGLGLGFASELLNKGFNVILHGRNPEKLERVRTGLLVSAPTRQLEIVVLDAEKDTKDPAKFSALTDRFANYHITLLINNVGGPGSASPLCSTHASRTPGHDRIALDINVCFTLEMTRAILPLLTQHGQPACIVNVGSGAARLPTPYIAVAGATKAFIEAWSKSLAAEMAAEGHKQVDVRYELVGMCSTGSEKRPVSFLVPHARTYARKSLALVGAGRRLLWGYWPHALQFEPLFGLPTWIKEMATTRIVKSQIMIEDQGRVAQRKHS